MNRNLDLTTGEAIDYFNALNTFVQKDIDLPLQVAWDIEDNLEALKKIVEKFEKHQSEILEPLQKDDLIYEKDNQILPKEGHQKEYMQALSDVGKYRDTKNSITVKTMQKSQLPETLSVKDVRALKFMIAEDNEKEGD